jgi:DHA3 family macrolide efflux protein-like MFS transporter
LSTYQAPPNGFRTFLIVWVTQSISVFGSALTFFAVNIWLAQTLYPLPEHKPALAWALAANALAFALPAVFGAPLAGAWADRHDRKQTMMAMDFANGCLSLLLVALLVTHTLQLWMLLVLSILYSTFGAFHMSSFDTSYAMLVPEQQLPRANGMMQTMWSLSSVLSPAVAAILISVPALARQGGVPIAALGRLTDGTPLAIALDAITFFVASSALLFINIPSPRRTDLDAEGRLNTSIWADVKQGALYIWHRRPLLWLLGSFTVINFVGTPLGVLQPLIVRFNLAADWSARGFTFETALALIGSALGVGGLVGGFLISAWGGLKTRRVYGVIVPMLVVGLAQLVLGLSPFLYLTAAMAFIIDSMSPIMNAHSQAIWQTQTPRELQGRVFAVRTMIAWVTIPLGTVVAGWVGGVFNPGVAVAALSAFLVLFCVAQLFNPVLLRVEDKAWLDQMAAHAETEPA